MASFSNNLRLKLINTGDEDGAWGVSNNLNWTLAADAFSAGTVQLAADSNEVFTIPDGTQDAVRSFYLKITSAVSLTVTRTVTLAPNTVSKIWMIENATSGGQSITVAQGSGGTVTIPNGRSVFVYTDGAGSGAAVVDIYATSGLKVGTNIQAYSAALQSISGLTTSADKMLYTTASNTYAVADLTAFARTLLDDANATTARATLGVTIGTQVQGFSAGLLSIANLTTEADRLPYAIAANTYALTTFTAFGRTIVATANAGAARTALELGTAAQANTGTSGATVPLLNASNTFSAPQTTKGTRMTLNAVSAEAIDWSAADYHTKSISANTTFTFSNVPSGAAAVIIVRVIVSGSRTIGWPASVRWPENIPPALTADRTHVFMFSTDDGGTIVRGAYLTNYTA